MSTCKRNHLICVLEVHDATGYGDNKSAVKIAEVTAYWLSIKEALQGEESYALINIANEPFGNGAPKALWLKEHQIAIKTLREAGLEHTLIVDAPNWGQDRNEIMLSHAAQLAAADTLKNTLFSVHMYQVYQDYNKINSYVTRFLNEQNLPLIVGEFGASHQGEHVDASSILRVAKAQKIGYLGWSWSGNSDCCTDLDIVKNFNPNALSDWGTLLLRSPNGIKNTAVKASVFLDE
nr:cellulase family glycosylhydrolase [Marinagarivorans cellulosilyticus]